MRSALNAYCGIRRTEDADLDRNEWIAIGSAHHSVYRGALPARRKTRSSIAG
jgi:hypothetical protein